MATNSPVTGSVDVAPVTTLRTTAPSSLVSPTRSSTTVFHIISILGFDSARSCMIFEARSASRRWIMVTFDANLVRNVASSTAESPPPTTAISWPRKKKPSHVAQVDSPCPSSRLSAWKVQHQALRAGADDDRVGRVLLIADPHLERPLAEVDRGDLLGQELGTETLRLLTELDHQLGAHDAVGEARVVLDLGGQHQLPARLIAGAGRLAFDDQWLEVGPRRVDGRGQPGRTGSDDDHIANLGRGRHFEPFVSSRASRFLMQNSPPSVMIPPRTT